MNETEYYSELKRQGHAVVSWTTVEANGTKHSPSYLHYSTCAKCEEERKAKKNPPVANLPIS